MNAVRAIYWIALVILIIGGLNWGLVGLFDYDLIAVLFGDQSVLSRIIYDLVGASAIYVAIVAAMVTKKSGEA